MLQLFMCIDSRSEQNRIFILFKHIQLITITKYKMHGLLNIHIQFNNYSLDGIKFTRVLEFMCIDSTGYI